jgi:hypothetical protein
MRTSRAAPARGAHAVESDPPTKNTDYGEA